MLPVACKTLSMQPVERMPADTRFCGFPAEVLSSSKRGGERQRVLKVAYHGAPIVIKCYGAKKGKLRALLRWAGCVHLAVGKSSPSAAARRRKEQEVMQVWAAESFAVPRLLDVDFLASAPQPCLAMELIPGPTLAAIMRSNEYSVAYKARIVARLARAMNIRHDRALAMHEPRLIVEHPSLTHIIVDDGRLAQIDFEISFTRPSQIERFARHEIAGTLLSIAKADRGNALAFLQAFAGAYGAGSRFQQTIEELRRYGSVPLAPILDRAGILMKASPRHRKIAAAARDITSL